MRWRACHGSGLAPVWCSLHGWQSLQVQHKLAVELATKEKAAAAAAKLAALP